MPTSVPMFPDAHALESSDFFYLLQGMNLDRDKKVTLAKIREYCTAQGVSLHELNTADAVSGTLTLSLGSSTTSAIVAVSGTGRNAYTLNVTGSVPPGCQVSVFDAASGSLKVASSDATVNGIDATLALSHGDGAVLVRGTGTVWWGSATRCAANVDAAILAESSRAEEEESALSQAITTEAQRAAGAEQSLGTGISSEVTARENADTALRQRIDALPTSFPTKIVSASTVYSAATAVTADTVQSFLSISLAAGSWLIDAVSNYSVVGAPAGIVSFWMRLSSWLNEIDPSVEQQLVTSNSSPDESIDNAAFSCVTAVSSTGKAGISIPVPRKLFTFSAPVTVHLKSFMIATPPYGTVSVFGRMTATSVAPAA